jgi:hypothetical protein
MLLQLSKLTRYPMSKETSALAMRGAVKSSRATPAPWSNALFSSFEALVRRTAVFGRLTLNYWQGDRPARPSHEWVEHASIYCVYLRSFSAQGFRGLQAELPRLAALGATVLWLLPVHPVGVQGNCILIFGK